MKKVISSADAPKAVGPYSQAIEKNGVLFLSGQIPLDPLSGQIVGNTIEQQTQQIFKNMNAVLSAAGYSLDDVVKTTVFLTNIDDFATVNAVYGRYFTTEAPARSAVAVMALPKGAMVEIEAIAIK
ncbi:MAG: RidA family protein [Paludibacteraceae bacterium]|nr:RidA family protein [Paludibacteraceae bacterium]